MKLPSHHQSEAKDWPTPFDRPTSEQQDADPQPSMVAGPLGEGDRALPTQKRTQAAPWKSFLALGMVSLGLHLLALRIPVPALQSVSKINPPIKVTRLTVTPKPKRSPPKAISKPTPIVVKPVVKLKVVAPSSPPQNRVGSPVAIASSPQLSPKPVVSPSPVSVASSSPKVSNTPSPQPIPSPTLVPETSQKPDPGFKSFPYYPHTAIDLNSAAFKTKDDFQTVVKHFNTALLGDQKQTWSPKVTIDEPDRRVYQITKGGETKFLSVFSNGASGTAYVLANQPMTEEDLKKKEQERFNAHDNFGKTLRD
jgi:hypothetical protein